MINPQVFTVLSAMKDMEPNSNPFYCFIDFPEIIASGFIEKLPDEFEWYEINGRKMFEIKDSFGMSTGQFAAYLVMRNKT